MPFPGHPGLDRGFADGGGDTLRHLTIEDTGHDVFGAYIPASQADDARPPGKRNPAQHEPDGD